MNSTVKQLLIWVFGLAVLFVGWNVVSKQMTTQHDKAASMTQVLNDADSGKISDVTIAGTEVTGSYKDSKESFHTTIPANYPDFYKDLRDHGVNVTIKDPQGNLWLSILIQALPILAIFALFVFMMRQMQSGGNKAMSFGKNRARLLSMQQKKITFKDVAGVDEAKEELKEIIEFPARGAEVPAAGRSHSQGRADGRASGNGQDVAGARGGGRGERSVLLDFRFGLRGDVCRVWARAAFATCLSRARRMLRASSSSTRSML